MQGKLKTATEWFLTLDKKDQGWFSQLWFLIPFALLLNVFNFVSMTQFGFKAPPINYARLCYWCAIIMLLREVAFGRWDRRAMAGAAIFGFMAVMAFMGADPATGTLVVMVFVARNVPFRRIAWVSFFSLVAVLAVTIVCSQTGVIPDTLISRTGSSLPRHCLGFLHPNVPAGYAFFALALWIYLRGRKFFVVDALVGAVVIGVLFYLADSRTSCGFAALLLVLAFVMRFVPEKKKIPPAIPIVVFALVCACAVGVLALCAAYRPEVEWMATLNKLMSNRLALGHKGFGQIGLNTLATSVDLIGGTLVDCGYVRMVLNFGWIYLLAFGVLALGVGVKTWRAGNVHLLVIMFVIALHGLFEADMYMMIYDQMVFLTGGLFYEGYSGFNKRGIPVSEES